MLEGKILFKCVTFFVLLKESLKTQLGSLKVSSFTKQPQILLILPEQSEFLSYFSPLFCLDERANHYAHKLRQATSNYQHVLTTLAVLCEDNNVS